MAYLAPTADEIRAVIKTFWQLHPDPSKQARADDQSFLDAKVSATQYLLRRFIDGGMDAQEAERRAMKSVALAE